MEDPQDSMKTVSGNYDRNLPDKLYDISKNVGPQQLQNIIDENIKIENENSFGVVSSSSSSFSDLDMFKKEGDDELSMAGYGSDESETDTDISGGASESDIIPEHSNLLIQNNNSGGARAVDFIPHPSDESLARKTYDDRMDKDSVLSNHK
jgi:hypothetical protein